MDLLTHSTPLFGPLPPLHLFLGGLSLSTTLHCTLGSPLQPKVNLIKDAIAVLGVKRALVFFEETVKIQEGGGQRTSNGNKKYAFYVICADGYPVSNTYLTLVHPPINSN